MLSLTHWAPEDSKLHTEVTENFGYFSFTILFEFEIVWNFSKRKEEIFELIQQLIYIDEIEVIDERKRL